MALVDTIRLGLNPRVIDQVTFDPGEVTNATTLEVSVSYPRARPDMRFLVPSEELEANLVWAGAPRCEVAGTVIFTIGNLGAAPINPAELTVVLIAL